MHNTVVAVVLSLLMAVAAVPVAAQVADSTTIGMFFCSRLERSPSIHDSDLERIPRWTSTPSAGCLVAAR